MNWTIIKRLADAAFNDIYSGLRGYHLTMSLSKELLEQEIVEMRLAVIKEYMIKGILPVDDLMMSINCIQVDCDTLDKCKCSGTVCGKPTAHFLIPQIVFDYGLSKAIRYIGSSNREHSFIVYTKSLEKVLTYLKYRKRGKNKPWVYVDITPNSEGLLDCYIFNAPLIKQLSVTAIFKDPRQLESFLCNCDGNDITQMDNNMNFLDIAIKDRLVLQKLRYYRQLVAPITPNDLRPA